MALILRETKGSKLTSAELDGNFTYLDNKGGGGSGLTQLKVSLTKEEVFSTGTLLLEAPGVNKFIDVVTAYVIPRNVTNLKDDLTGQSPSQHRISSYILTELNGADLSLLYAEDMSFYLESGNLVKYFPFEPDNDNPKKSVAIFNAPIYINFGGGTPPYTAIPTADGNFPDTKGTEVVVTGSITGSSASMIGNDNSYALFLDSSFNGSFTHSEILSWTDAKGSGTFSLTSEDKYSFGPWNGTMDVVLSYQIIDLD